MMVRHPTTFGHKGFRDSEDISRTNIDWHFEPSLWPWPWTQQSNFLTRYSSLWWYTISLSLVAKRSAVQKIQPKLSYFDNASSCYDLDLEVSTQIFQQDTQAHDNASSHQVWSQKVQRFGRYRQDKHSITIWTFAVTLTLNTAIQYSHQTFWLKMMYHQTKFGWKGISSSEDTVETQILVKCKPSLWPWSQHTNLSAWPSRSWCCTTIPSLVTKFEQFRRYHPDKIRTYGQTDTRTDGHSDSIRTNNNNHVA